MAFLQLPGTPWYPCSAPLLAKTRLQASEALPPRPASPPRIQTGGGMCTEPTASPLPSRKAQTSPHHTDRSKDARCSYSSTGQSGSERQKEGALSRNPDSEGKQPRGNHSGWRGLHPHPGEGNSAFIPPSASVRAAPGSLCRHSRGGGTGGGALQARGRGLWETEPGQALHHATSPHSPGQCPHAPDCPPGHERCLSVTMHMSA